MLVSWSTFLVFSFRDQIFMFGYFDTKNHHKCLLFTIFTHLFFAVSLIIVLFNWLSVWFPKTTLFMLLKIQIRLLLISIYFAILTNFHISRTIMLVIDFSYTQNSLNSINMVNLFESFDHFCRRISKL